MGVSVKSRTRLRVSAYLGSILVSEPERDRERQRREYKGDNRARYYSALRAAASMHI